MPVNVIQNGMVVQSPSFTIAVIQFIDVDKYCLLYVSRSINGLNCMMPIRDPDKSGKWIYTKQEMLKRLEHWETLYDYSVDIVFIG